MKVDGLHLISPVSGPYHALINGTYYSLPVRDHDHSYDMINMTGNSNRCINGIVYVIKYMYVILTINLIDNCY